MPLRPIALAVALALAALAGTSPASAAPRAVAKKAQAARTTGPRFGARPELRAFAAEVAARQGLDRAWVLRQLARAQKVEAVRRLVMPAPAGVAKDWGAYRDRFVEPQRIGAGLAFWHDHADALARAERAYGVPPAVVVGVLGVETYFGRLTGAFRVVDALTTLGFAFPPGRSDRSAFFRAELEAFLLLCHREHVDPQLPKGSYAGAIGLAQFMPSNIERFAVDFDGDGHVDLSGSADDAIGSIARYLSESGWRRGEPATFDVVPPDDAAERARLLQPDVRPSFAAADFAAHGAALAEAGRGFDGPLALVELQNGGRAPSYVAGTPNFHALTRYNPSAYYAMAVLALGDAIASARTAETTSPR